MSQPNSPTTEGPLLTTGGIFVIHLRSDSDLGHRHLCGRIEHVMSGQNEPFGCLSEMLDFMARYPLEPPVLESSEHDAVGPAAGQYDED